MTNLVTLCTSCHRRLHVITERALFLAHPETVLSIFGDFLGDEVRVAAE